MAEVAVASPAPVLAPTLERQLYGVLQEARTHWWRDRREKLTATIRTIVNFGDEQLFIPIKKERPLPDLFAEIEKRLAVLCNKKVSIKRLTYTEDGITINPKKKVGQVIKDGVTVWAYDTEPTTTPEIDVEIEELEQEFPEPDPFTVTRRVVRDPASNEVVDTQVILKITDQRLKTVLRSVVNSDALYNKKAVELSASMLIKFLPSIKTRNYTRKTHKELKLTRLKAKKIYKEMLKVNPSAAEKLKDKGSTRSSSEVWAPLIEFLTKEYAAVTKKIEKMLSEGKINYDSLWYIFNENQEIKARVETAWVGMKIKTAKYVRSSWSPSYSVVGNVIKTNGAVFYHTDTSYKIPPFTGVMELKDLPFAPLEPETKKELMERGKMFVKYGKGPHYMRYTGAISKKQWWAVNQIRADGRVMVDCQMFCRMNPNYSEYSKNPSKTLMEVPEENLWMTWPTIGGFSFTAKQWGEISVVDLMPIKWDASAYDGLVFPPKKKALIESLVKNQARKDLKLHGDFIEGKGSGCVFLLHGSPGTGKTLTAEAIAELLRRPLYSVSVGELGTETDQLEDRLQEILVLAEKWNAVILIDEADIFLEARADNDVTRNAMVGVFLRLLEYHEGVLFLTTNRVKCFDSAFHSRISVALKYHDLDAVSRGKVWAGLLKAAGVTWLNTDDLVHFELNGRQIRTTIRLAQAVAKAEGKPLNVEHISQTVAVTAAFKSAFA